jgi:hypothetical protein
MAGQILYLITPYGRSRVYHPANGGYVSSEGLAGDIDDLRQWQREGVAFVVLDTGDGRGRDAGAVGVSNAPRPRRA